ncbi:MAG: hypothetical protein PHY19_01630 [Methanocellales archaeon]|nr:hypothetical protein [Methanocellales archaeon]MDD3291223.1 hypothetical protein [Methanocellales archaeon]
MIDADNVIDDVINDPNTIASLDEREIDKCLKRQSQFWRKKRHWWNWMAT